MARADDSNVIKRLREFRLGEDGFGLVEALMALTILVIGLLAVSGLTLATATQARVADLRSDQMVAGQDAIEKLRRDGFAAAASSVDTVTSGSRVFYVNKTVTSLNARSKLVDVTVTPAAGGLTARSFSAVLHAPRALPSE